MPENDRDKDRFDIAIFRVNNDQDSAFRSAYKPLSIEDIDVNDIPSEKKYYAFVGHPTNKTKLRYGTLIVKSEMYSYTGSVADNSAYEELSLFPFFHVVVNFDSTKCLNRQGERYNFPKVKGMSGGGVWLLEDLNLHSSKSHINKLVGIGIECHNTPKVLVGTRIGAVIELIKSKFDNCEDLPEINFKIKETHMNDDNTKNTETTG